MALDETLKKIRRTKMGATNPRYAKQATHPDGGLPTYDSQINDFSEMVSVTEALDFAEASFYSNDKKSESDRSFKGCTLTFENKGLSVETVADIYGANISDEGELRYGGNDAPPRIGFSFYRTISDKGTRYYEGVFYPDCKAALGNATDNTRGENLTYNGDTTTLDVYAGGDDAATWKVEALFTTAEEADEWCQKKLGKAGE